VIEEYFPRMRRVEIGIHQCIAGAYLLRCDKNSYGKRPAAAKWDQLNRVAAREPRLVYRAIRCVFASKMPLKSDATPRFKPRP
jgi:hypothetical protein